MTSRGVSFVSSCFTITVTNVEMVCSIKYFSVKLFSGEKTLLKRVMLIKKH